MCPGGANGCFPVERLAGIVDPQEAGQRLASGSQAGMSSLRRERWTIAIMVVLLIGFTLRVIRLDQQPLWWDEGLNAYFADQDVSTLISDTRITHDANPPVYRLFLGVWRNLAGSSTFAIRFFSAMVGVIVIGFSWVVGRWLADAHSALLLTLFVAVAPMQVYYAREAKGYAFAAACALLSTYAWGRRLGYGGVATLQDSGKAHWWVVYVLSTAAAIGTHYYLAPLLVWQGLRVLWRGATALTEAGPEGRAVLRSTKRWMVAAATISLILLPWVWVVFGSTVEGVTNVSGGDGLPLLNYLGRVGQAIGAGPGYSGAQAVVITGGLVVLGILGALSAGTGGLLISWIAVPLLVAYLLQLTFSFFFPRFLLYVGIPFYLLVSRGVTALGAARWHVPTAAVLLLIAAVIGLWSPGLRDIYTPTADQDEDPRPAIARLRDVADPDDALVYVYVWQVGYVLGHYPQHEFSFYRAYWTPQTVGDELTSILGAHSRLWSMSYNIGAQDPQNLSGSWLEENAYRVDSGWYGRHHLSLYVGSDFQTAGIEPDAGTAAFDGRIELHYPKVRAELQGGDVLALPLRWHALADIKGDYAVFVHVGPADAAPLAQDDGRPRNGLEPTATWGRGQEVLDRRALLVPDDVPPGRYPVRVGLYCIADGTRLLIDGSDGADAAELGYVEVGR